MFHRVREIFPDLFFYPEMGLSQVEWMASRGFLPVEVEVQEPVFQEEVQESLFDFALSYSNLCNKLQIISKSKIEKDLLKDLNHKMNVIYTTSI